MTGSRFHAQLSSRPWQRLRLKIFERDGWRCVKCGRPGRLECDHKIPLDQGGDPWNPANLQTLCRGCHIEKSRSEREPRFKADPERERWRALVSEIAEEGKYRFG